MTPPGTLAQPAPSPNSAGGNRIGLLLPLSGNNAALGHAMLQAAQLALDVPGAPPITLDPQDTVGTPQGAANAAQQAIAAGDRLLIGPITAPDTAAAAGAATAAAVPMLAFTSDATQARPGVWTLGVTPDQQVRRLIAATQADNRTRFAAVLPDNPLGQAMGDALSRFAAGADLRNYASGSTSGLQSALADIADYAGRHPVGAASAMPTVAGPPPAPKPPPRMTPARAPFRGLNPNGDVTPGGNARSASPDPLPAARSPEPPPAPAPAAIPAAPVEPPPFDALLVAETGSRAEALGPMLSRDDITQPKVRVLGPGLWQSDADRLGGLAGAWFAAPDPAARMDFVRRYQAKYGGEPPHLADLAYDAASLGRVLAQGGNSSGDFSTAALTRPEGFAGTDGVLALQPDGHVRRGLALFEISRGGGARIVAPSPASLGAPGV